MAPMDTFLQMALIALQGLWGLFLVVLGFAIKRVLQDLQSNTSATQKIGEELHALNLKLLGDFATKTEHREHGDRLRLLEHLVTGMEAREKVRDVGRRQ